MIDILRKFMPQFMRGRRVTTHLRGVLSKLLLCRTAMLDGRTWECPQCATRCQVYNSCTDRHCPQCMGARRATWLSKTSELLLPNVNYFQVVFTLPDLFSPLILGNRKLLYDLLFHSAWQAIRQTLQTDSEIDPAAVMVLPTWNQELGHHPHLHALVPGGGPARDGSRWIATQHPTQRRRTKPYLTDNSQLGAAFRDHFAAGFRRLVRTGKLRLTGAWADLWREEELNAWLAQVTDSPWNVFIEGPPHGKSDPSQVLKYLARYLTGGPISDRRVVQITAERVTFLARSKDKSAGNPLRECQLPGVEFVRRWAMHVLPKGYTRSRCYGGYHGAKRQAYLQLCRELLPPPPPPPTDDGTTVDALPPAEDTMPCPKCESAMLCTRNAPRPGWRDIFERLIYADPKLYSPHFHLPHGADDG